MTDPLLALDKLVGNALQWLVRSHHGRRLRRIGWYVSPYFALARDPARIVLRTLLVELAERLPVRVLLWAGSPLPLFRPDRHDVEGVGHAMTSGTKIQVARDRLGRPMHCHHEKVVVIDDRVAFVGGIDLTTYAGDRYDSRAHEARGTVGWHDAACLLRGPAVADVAEHFRRRWEEVAGEELPSCCPPIRTTERTTRVVSSPT